MNSPLILIEKAVTTHALTHAELVTLLSDNATTASLLFAANRVRQQYVGDAVQLRGLIEFSSFCRQNCLYCGLRRDNKDTVRYRLSANEIVNLAQKAKEYGYQTVVLQSGEDAFFTQTILCDIITRIKALNLAITLSVGERTFEEYQSFRKAGTDRYLLRIETTDKALYERLDPSMSWDNRLRCLKDLRTLGYEVGSGSLVGLPGQTLESIASDILFFKELNADMIGVGPFIPNPKTPLADTQVKGHFELSLKVMALTRLLLPDINIPATTAMETLHPRGRLIALESGANVVMPNVTEGEHRKDYELYPGKICTGETPQQCRDCIETKIRSIGRTIGKGKGFHGEFLKGQDTKE